MARHTGAAQNREYEVNWANTYRLSVQYTATATRCGNAVLNRHRAPQSRLVRALATVPRAKSCWVESDRDWERLGEA